jgi:MSHA biogenesis protein MshQ
MMTPRRPKPRSWRALGTGAAVVIGLCIAIPLVRFAFGASANFQNGNFAGSTNLGTGDVGIAGLNTTSLTGWTIAANSSIDVVGSAIWSASPGNTSNYSVDLDGTNPGTLSQTFATTTGQAYTLNFDLSANYLGTATNTVKVTVAGASQNYSVSPAGKSANNMGYVTQALAFTATAASTTLTFTSLDAANSSHGPVIDNVRILTTISGTVFEDKNYGGGAGRNLATAAGVARSGARVELYSSSGAFVSATTTNSAGLYSFPVDINNSYTVRVVNATVTSARAGTTNGLIGVQTFRTNASGGSATDVLDHVGGETPSLIDAGSNTGNASLASLTTATTTPESITAVAVATATVTGLDFGFNFDTIVNTGASGQGSLQQWVANADAFTDQASLAQSGSRKLAGTTTALAAGVETSIFMIPNGSAVGGLRAGLANALTSSAFARITPSAGALNITAANVTLAGATQTANVGDTNAGKTGTGGTVGVGATTLAQFDLPEVEIDLPAGNCVCLNGAADALEAVAMSSAKVQANANYSLVSDVLIGLDAQGNSNATTTDANSGAYGVAVAGVSNVTVNHNYVRANSSGVRRDNTGSNLTVQYNEITSPYNGQNNTYDGVIIYPGSGDLVAYNLIHNIVGAGVEVPWGGGTNFVVKENTLSGNGLTYGTTTASTEPGGIVIYGSMGSPRPQMTISRNIITGSGGDGIAVLTGSGFLITQNSLYGNNVGKDGGLGIDLNTVGYSDGNNFAPAAVLVNNGAQNTAQPNNGEDYPVITAAGVSGTTFSVLGYVGTPTNHSAFANATLEFFKSSASSSGYGEGQTYLGTLTADANGLFAGVITVPTGVSLAITNPVTATATDASGNTSEFGPNFSINSAYVLTPGSFNAFESSTAAGSITGVIQTKIAGSSFALDLVAVNALGTGVYTNFTGTVTVQLLDSSNNTGALVNTCRSTWVPIGGTTGSATFAISNGGRVTTNFNAANAYRDARVQITYVPPIGATVVNCSTDNFAIRPSTLAQLAATDATWTTPGLGRALGNGSATGGNVHKAGQYFTLSAQAQNAVGALTANYSGTTTAILGCLLPAGCTAANLGTLTFTPTLTAGVMNTNDGLYSDVGSFTLQLVDTTFAAVDAADSTTAQRYIYSSAVTVGRFVPDHFALSVSANGTQYTYGTGACTTRSFTYQGQPVGYKSLPIVSVIAQNASNGTTANYKNELWKLTGASVSQAYTDAGGNAVSAVTGTATVTSNGNGSGTISPNAGDTVTWVRSTTAPSAPFTAQAVDTLNVSDTSETSGAITAAPAATIDPVFDAGASMVYGRAALTNAFGVETLSLAVPAETQYYTGSVWITNTADFCTALPGAALAFANWQRNLSACETSVTAGGIVSRGRTSLVLSAPGSGNSGSVDLTLNLGAAASGNACVGGSSQASSTTGLSFLQGAWGGGSYTVNPSARASFGQYGVVPGFRRED